MIVLDTHAWVWWLSNPENLSEAAGNTIESAIRDAEILISSISAWEIALLVATNRLKLTMAVSDWIGRSEGLPFVRFVPVDNRIAVNAVSLKEPFHKDPADRIIVATAASEGVPIITKDARLLDYPHVETIW